jgi:hypothetical protein
MSKNRPSTSSGSKQVTTYGIGERCEAAGCETILSRYNDKRVCAAHDPARFPGV